MRAGAFIISASMIAVAAVVAPVARAQTSTDSTAADVLFEEGRLALGRGDVKTACERFEASRRLEPAVGTLLNLGECSAKLERRRAAWIAFREALRSMSANDDRRSYAEGRIRELEAKLGRIVVRWTGPVVSGTSVIVNDETITPPYDVPRIVDPGKVVVRGAAPGYRGRTFEASVAEGGVASVDVDAGERVATTADPASPSSSIETHSTRRVLGYGLGGAGIAALGVGTYFGVSALAASSDAEARCGGLSCADESSLAAARSEAETASSRATVSTILLAAGVMLAGAGIYLVLTSSPSSSSRAHAETRRLRDPLRVEF